MYFTAKSTVFSGGLGGHPGFYSFVHGVNDAEHVPKSVANVGSIGEDGKMPPNIGGETSCDIEDEHLCTLSNSILDGEPFGIYFSMNFFSKISKVSPKI